MDLYDSLLAAIGNEFDIMTQIKKSARGEVLLVRHKENGTRYIFRHFEGSSEVYKEASWNFRTESAADAWKLGEKTAGQSCWRNTYREIRSVRF